MTSSQDGTPARANASPATRCNLAKQSLPSPSTKVSFVANMPRFRRVGVILSERELNCGSRGGRRPDRACSAILRPRRLWPSIPHRPARPYLVPNASRTIDALAHAADALPRSTQPVRQPAPHLLSTVTAFCLAREKASFSHRQKKRRLRSHKAVNPKTIARSPRHHRHCAAKLRALFPDTSAAP